MIRNKRQLIRYLQQGHEVEYLFFWGHRPRKDGRIGKNCLSQWFESGFTVDEEHFKTAEHYMMAQKARLFHDERTRKVILEAETPKDVQKLGRAVMQFHQKKWEHHREQIVIAGNRAKFLKNTALRTFLFSTGTKILVEASPDDSIWGIGLAENHEDVKIPQKWPGLNLLGFALMDVRHWLRSQSCEAKTQTENSSSDPCVG